MYISSTFSFDHGAPDPSLAFKLLRSLFQKVRSLKASAIPKALSYFDKPTEIMPDGCNMYVVCLYNRLTSHTDFIRPILVVGYVTSTTSAHIYAGYMFSPFCSVAIKVSKPGENLHHEYLMLKHIGSRIHGVQRLQLWTNLSGRPTLVTSPFGVALST